MVLRLRRKSNNRHKSREIRESSKRRYLRENWWVIVSMVGIILVAFFLRTYFNFGPATEDGFVFVGTDPYYHKRVVDHVLDTHTHLIKDPMLNYPIGATNPRPPLFDWNTALLSMLIMPFVGYDKEIASGYASVFIPAIWGAVTVIPVYFLTRELFGRKAGVLAGLLIAIMPEHIQGTGLGLFDHDPMVLFFVTTTAYFYIKALRLLNEKEWVKSWRSGEDIKKGFKGFYEENRDSIGYAVLAGLSLSIIALIWEGFVYFLTIILVYYLVQLIINTLRKKDSLGIFMVTMLLVGVALLLSFPYYNAVNKVLSPWGLLAPLIMLGAMLFFTVIFVATRNIPWLIVLPTFIIVSVASFFAFSHFFPDTANMIFTGLGYFAKTKVVQTIGEAQSPQFSKLAYSFGVATFYLAFVGMIWIAIKLPKTWKNHHFFLLTWGIFAVYMMSVQVRFLFNASPIFAIFGGWVIWEIIRKLDYRSLKDRMLRTTLTRFTSILILGFILLFSTLLLIPYTSENLGFSSIIILSVLIPLLIAGALESWILRDDTMRALGIILSLLSMFLSFLIWLKIEDVGKFLGLSADYVTMISNALFWAGLAGLLGLLIMGRGVKVRHVAGALFLAFLVVFPNAWSAIDASIPSESKKDYDKAMYEFLPSWAKPPNGTGLMKYNKESFGSLWYLGAFGQSYFQDYWIDGLTWLSKQDTKYPEKKRPAFISWWDYGFQAVQVGDHPTVADNFQSGYTPAGLFITAQNESSGIAILIIRILKGDLSKDGLRKTDPILREYLGDERTDEIIKVLKKPSRYVKEVENNPGKYGGNFVDVVPKTARYVVARYHLCFLDLDTLANLYKDIQEATGKSIRYFAVDSRMFPFQWFNQGIFYAPVKLTDQRIDENGYPQDYFQVFAVTDRGVIPIDDVKPDDTVTGYQLKYYEPFYNTMFYRAYLGYSGSDVGQSNEDFGFPGLTNTQYPPMPAWMLKHFRIVYKTVYWNPYNESEAGKHPDAWKPINYAEAIKLQEEGKGVMDPRSGLTYGVQMIEFYEGVNLSGRVRTENGIPMPNVTVTVLDEFGIPHDTTTTDENGSYSLIAPFGTKEFDYNVTVIASRGREQVLSKTKDITLNRTTMQFTREDARIGKRVKQDLIVESASLNGTVFWDLDKNNEFNEKEDKALPNVTVSVMNLDSLFTINATTNETGFYEFEELAPGPYKITLKIEGHEIEVNSDTFSFNPNIDISRDDGLNLEKNKSYTQDITLREAKVLGMIDYENGTFADAINVTLRDKESEELFINITDEEGRYEFSELLPGDYILSVEKHGYLNHTEDITLNQEDEKEINVTLYPSLVINGTVYNEEGQVMSGVTIDFKVTDAGLNSTVKSAENGSYQINLPEGKYTVQIAHTADNKTYAYIERWEVRIENDTRALLISDEIVSIPYNITLQRGVKVSGYVYYNDTENIKRGVNITFESPKGTLNAVTNSTGYYEMYLMPYNYQIKIDYFENNTMYVYLKNESINSAMKYNISLEKGIKLEGKIYWDKDRDGNFTEDEEIQNSGGNKGKLTFSTDTGSLTVYTKKNGGFEVHLPENRTFKLSIERFGFYPNSTTIIINKTTKMKFALLPENITVNGFTWWDKDRNEVMSKDELLENITIRFEHLDIETERFNVTTSTNESYGSFNRSMYPGRYRVEVHESVNNARLEFEDELNLNYGEKFRWYNITLRKYVTINGTTFIALNNTLELAKDVTITFKGEEFEEEVKSNGQGNYTIELLTNNYTMFVNYEYENETYAYLYKENFIDSVVWNITLTSGYRINGTVFWHIHGNETNDDIENITDTTVIFKGGNETNNATWEVKTGSSGTGEGVFVIILAGGTYEIKINRTEFEVYNETIELNESIEHNITLEPRFINVTIITFDESPFGGGSPIPNITVYLTHPYHNNTYGKNLTTDENGTVSVFLRPGVRYNVSIEPFINNNTDIRYNSTVDKILVELGKFSQNETVGIHKYIMVRGIAFYYADDKNQTAGNAFVTLRPTTMGDEYQNLTADGEGALQGYVLKEIYEINCTYSVGNVGYRYLNLSYTINETHDFIYINLSRSFHVSGKVYYDGKAQDGTGIDDLRFTFSSSNYTDEVEFDYSGYYELYLFSDTYAVSLSYTKKEEGTTYLYEFSGDLTVNNTDEIFDINLTKRIRYKVNLSVDESSKALKSNESVEFTFTVYNEGAGSDSFNLKVENVPEGWSATFDSERTSSIQEGRNTTVRLTVKAVNASVKDIRAEKPNTIAVLRVTATSTSESDKNASLEITARVRLPDYIVEKIWLSEEHPRKDRNVTIYARVKNIEGVEVSDNITVSFEVDGKLIGYREVSIPAHTSVEVNMTWKTTVGEHKITVTVNANKTVDEMDEVNNAADKPITIDFMNWTNLIILITAIIISIIITVLFLRRRSGM